MLVNLHVKNLALIEESEVEFGPGLNILTGETGAGKSMLLGAVNLALGGKFEKEMLHKGESEALVELCFQCSREQCPELYAKLAEQEIPVDEDQIFLSRRMQTGKSVYRLNGEVVNAKLVKEAAEYLLDIHGQHEHQSLLRKSKHLEILDAYIGSEAQELLQKISTELTALNQLKRELQDNSAEGDALKREQDLLAYEVQEIQQAHLREGEDEQLEETYRLMVNGQKITSALAECGSYTDSDRDGASTAISRALRCLYGITDYDKKLENMATQLSEIEDLLNDFNRDLADYQESLEFDPGAFAEIEDRLNVINRLKDKYGATVARVLEACEEKQARLDQIEHYDEYLADLQKRILKQQAVLDTLCDKLSALRREGAKTLTGELIGALEGLNFAQVRLEIAIEPREEATSKGRDDVEFLISTNPGEDLKSLSHVASGGELSRIMLGIKTILARKDEIDTLIFDEIDTGISGKTAWQVAKQLSTVASAHQVICITHLPQIASMADVHFVIEKQVEGDRTTTAIRPLDGQESKQELGRLLGGGETTQAVLDNAEDMLSQARKFKLDIQ